MSKGDGERIMVSALHKVPWNHITRYRWAMDELLKLGATTAIDGACGIGYGSLLAAKRGFEKVYAYDRDPDCIEYQKKYAHPNVVFTVADLKDVEPPKADCAISIETIEHIPCDREWLAKLRAACKFLAVTVPNQDVIPFDPAKHIHHLRHYTKAQLTRLLLDTGWSPLSWATQYEKWNIDRATMRPGDDGMTLGVICQ
jgi:2-polyprenyl-3-methyl-5-hydroxy-6-metoxy-1,4-benzoquinol methylase